MQYTNSKHTYRKDGVFYFSKQVPSDVRSYYSKQRIVLCLRTKLSAQAQQASKAVLAKLKDYWLQLRIKDLDVPASHLFNESLSVTAGMPTIEDALNLYLDLKGVGRGEPFFKAARWYGPSSKDSWWRNKHPIEYGTQTLYYADWFMTKAAEELPPSRYKKEAAKAKPEGCSDPGFANMKGTSCD